MLRKFLKDKYSPPLPVVTVPKDTHYIKLPYFGKISFHIRRNLYSILRESYPQINFQIIFKNNLTIGSLLKHADHLPFALKCGVVYLYKCSRCNSRYVGSTSRPLLHRIFEHKGRSFRTGNVISRPSASSIRDHCLSQDHPLTNKDFSILASTPDRLDLIILESLHIANMKPELNCSTAAVQLYTH